MNELNAAGKICPLAVVVTDGGKDGCDWWSEILLSAVWSQHIPQPTPVNSLRWCSRCRSHKLRMLLVMTSWACFYNTLNESLLFFQQQLILVDDRPSGGHRLTDAQIYRNPGAIESILTGNIASWQDSCTAQDGKALQQVIKNRPETSLVPSTEHQWLQGVSDMSSYKKCC